MRRDSSQIEVHKSTRSASRPEVSIILLDWSCRERYHTVDWLTRQDVSRDTYEIVWVELYDRVVTEVFDKVDTLITCSQKGVYHKHVGYNTGVLYSSGRIVTVCDSDAVFPHDFVRSIVNTFTADNSETYKSVVLMHHEYRSRHQYPDNLNDIGQLPNYEWAPLWPNVGACMSATRRDVIQFGGFDEHKSFRGYLCGPYDLGWRLVNAGLPEIWHDPSVALWHFAHPDPVASFGQTFSIQRWREKTYPHIDHHAFYAVEAFSTGRLLPLSENPDIRDLRLRSRIIGTTFEEQYSQMDHLFSNGMLSRVMLHLRFYAEPIFGLGADLLRRLFGDTFVRYVRTKLFHLK